MAANWPWNLPEKSGSGNTKGFEGISSNSDIESLIQRCIDTVDIAKNESDDFNNAAIVTRAVASVPIQNALQTLIDFQNITKPTAVPLAVIRAIYSILPSSELSQLDKAVSNASFVFSDPLSFVDETTVESRRFKKRMDRLRLRAEEMQYHKLTSNLDHVVEDDVTTRSMTYAASVGLNMIVAPISFGVFMYFFAGQIFSWVSGGDSEEGASANVNKVDIKGVIAGVVSGVFMLIVEMLLFVIRSHTFDKEITKKKRRKKLSPFGYTRPESTAEEINGAASAKDVKSTVVPPATTTTSTEKRKKKES